MQRPLAGTSRFNGKANRSAPLITTELRWYRWCWRSAGGGGGLGGVGRCARLGAGRGDGLDTHTEVVWIALIGHLGHQVTKAWVN